MKNYLLISTCLLILSPVTLLKAQETSETTETMENTEIHSYKTVELGIRYMPTVSAFQIQTYSGGTVKGQATFGHGYGGMMALNFSNHFGFQGELIYYDLSQKYKDQDLNREINVKYLNLPLMLSLNTGKSNPVNLNFVFGPQFGLNLGSEIKRSGGSNTDTFTYVLATKQNDFGIAYGGGFEFMLNEFKTIRLDLGFRGVHGFMNIHKTSSLESETTVYIIESAKVRTKSLYFGLSFLF
jgi:hypothetical protein